MSKFVGLVVGFGEAFAGGAIAFISALTGSVFLMPLATALIEAGIGTMLAGAGTLLGSLISGGGAQSQQQGVAFATRNPIKGWDIINGRACVGGTIVFLNEFGDNNVYLDSVVVLAAHPCQAFDRLLFDKQYVQLQDNGDGTYDSFSPLQQTVNITRIVRADGVVTATLDADIPLLQPGDTILSQSISGAPSLEGRWPVSEVTHGSGTCTVIWLSGGTNTRVDIEGKVITQWADYGRKIHLEVMLGTQTLGQTFPGMLYGTPNDGDPTDNVFNSSNPWNANCSLVGHTAVFLRLHYDQAIFSAGLPTISFLMRGKNDIYDPRLGAYGDPGTTGYTENAALAIADYLNNPEWGFRAVYGSELPLDLYTAEANICDEAVPLAAGGTEPRYTMNGTFDLSISRGEILQNMLTACAGRLPYQAGQFALQTSAWRGSSPVAAPGTGAMSAGFRWSPKGNPRDLFNGVKGTYICPANNWHPSDVPPYAQDEIHGYSSDANLAADLGERRWQEVQLPFTISSATAQRLCKIELLRLRQMGEGTFRYNMSAYRFAALDVITMDLAVFGWTAKQLEIQAHRFIVDKQQGADGKGDVPVLGIEMDARETDASIYDWDTSEELTPEGFQQPVMPNPYTPAPPTDLVLTSDLDTAVSTPAGLVDSILVSWTTPADGYVISGGHIEIQYREQATYLAGTVAVTNGNANVTGTGTAWTAQLEGGTLTIGGTDFVIKTVSSPTALVLAEVFSGTTASGQSYGIGYTGPWIGLPSVNPSVTQVFINAVDDGAIYDVQIRSVNAGGFPSAWVTGEVTAAGAALPMPWKPNGEDYSWAKTGRSFHMQQGVSGVTARSLLASGSPPTNVTSQSIGAPSIEKFPSVAANGSGTLTVGTWYARLFGVDSGGAYSAGSNIAQFTVTAATQEVSIGVTWAASTVAYELFLGKHIDELQGLGKQTPGSLPSAITFHSFTLQAYGPPDPRAVRALMRAKQVFHGGIAGAMVFDKSATTIKIGIPSAATADEFAGRMLIVVNKAGLPSTQNLSLIPITHSDTGAPLCTLTVPSPMGNLVGLGDVVLISTLASSASGTGIEDTGFVSPFGSSGLATDQDAGALVRILYDPTSKETWGATARVKSNTSTAHATEQFRLPDGTAVTPGVGSMYEIEEPTWRAPAYTSVMLNSTPPTSTAGSDPIAALPIGDLGGITCLIQVLLQDESGNLSDESTDTLRMVYLYPEELTQSTIASSSYNVQALDEVLTFTAGASVVNLPPLAATSRRPLRLVNRSGSPLTLNAFSGEKIEGASTLTLGDGTTIELLPRS